MMDDEEDHNDNNVVKFNSEVELQVNSGAGIRVDVTKVLESAKDNNYTDILIIGNTKDGDVGFHSTSGNAADIVYKLELMKSLILSAG